ncbi:hypothetical protein C8J57DRAFT_1259101 [Mycena rebaudengoi]|nr:hypothetical protein C8J57DRAFT_1259101 [Mycena rebaudengoi]
MTNFTQAAAAGTEATASVPADGSPATNQTALSAVNGPGASDATIIALLSAALSALTAGPSLSTSTTVSNTSGAATGLSSASVATTIPAPITVATTPAATTAPAPPPSCAQWGLGSLKACTSLFPWPPFVDDGEERLWYCITKGTYVGITTINALAISAVSGVSSSSMVSHKTQAAAVASFNLLLGLGLVQIR